MKTKRHSVTPLILFTFIILNIVNYSCKPEEDCDDEPICDTCSMLYKPNIYIYPETNIQLNVELEFPLGGHVVTSIPEYGTGWNVSIDTNGLIDDTYTYLFYESTQPYIWQKKHGWVVEQTKLTTFFTQNMIAYGFDGQEIQDFIDYWIPRLTDEPYYAIYPQTAELIKDAVVLKLSEEPDNLLRLFYVVVGTNLESLSDMEEATIDSPFKREGYFISEWGVILN